MEFVDAIIALIPGFAAQYPVVMLIVSILGTLVVVGQAVVTLTPGTADDGVYAKIMGVPILGKVLLGVSKFAIIQKK